MAKYFPVSQDINADPEVWELTDKFGDRSIRIWLEILSISDRNKGELPGQWIDYPRILAGRCHSSARHVREVCEWVARWLEINSEGVARVRNYEKYHKIRSDSRLPPNLTEPNLTISSHQNAQKSNNSPSAGFDKSKKKEGDFDMSRSMNLSPELKLVADKVYGSDPEKFKRIAAWIGQGRKHAYLESDMAEALSQFWEYRFIDDWYPYLDQILDKVVKTRHAREHDLETERLRREAREFTEGKAPLALVRGLGQAKAVK